MQIPSWESALFDLEEAAESKTYCEDLTGRLSEKGIEIIEIGSYLQGQVLAFHPAYAPGLSGFYPKGLAGKQVTDWAADQRKKSVRASVHLGTETSRACRAVLRGI